MCMGGGGVCCMSARLVVTIWGSVVVHSLDSKCQVVS